MKIILYAGDYTFIMKMFNQTDSCNYLPLLEFRKMAGLIHFCIGFTHQTGKIVHYL